MSSLLLALTVALFGVLAVASLMPAQAYGMRRRILLVGLVLLLGLPAVRWFASGTDLVLDLHLAPREAAAAASQAPAFDWAMMMFACWLLGTGAMVVRLFMRWRGMQALVDASEDASHFLPQSMHRVAGIRGESVHPQVRVSTRVATACVALWKGKPVILLPEQALAWRPSTLRSVLRHEMEHARRGDLWWRLAGEVALALWWWHPLAHVVLRRWTEACEQVCDDAVLKSGVRPDAYARSLLALAGGAVMHPPAPVMAFLGRSPSRLRRRVASILSHHREGSVNPSWVACVAMGVLALILVFAATVHLRSEGAAHRAELQSEAELRFDANPFPADP